MHKTVIYLYGMNSSPASEKAKLIETYINKQFATWKFKCPQQLIDPIDNVNNLLTKLNNLTSVCLIGNSLGGYYATWLREKLLIQHNIIRMILINPVVKPQLISHKYLGINYNIYTNQTYEITHQHLEKINYLATQNISYPQDVMVLLTTGDEILDYRLAKKHYRQCQVYIRKGGDHSYKELPQELANMMSFLSN